MSAGDSYYRLLQVDPCADSEIIESAYRRLALKYHPDVNPAPEASETMQAINQAYATLGNPSRRAIYDRQLPQSGIRERLAHRVARRVVDDQPTSARIDVQPDTRALLAYRDETEPLKERAALALRSWAAAWAMALEEVTSGDPSGRRHAAEAAHQCLSELSTCLVSWEGLVAPPAARRLGDLGAACLRLQLALVRGTLEFTDNGDFSVLRPLAGLAQRIDDLTKTLAAQSQLISRAA